MILSIGRFDRYGNFMYKSGDVVFVSNKRGKFTALIKRVLSKHVNLIFVKRIAFIKENRYVKREERFYINPKDIVMLLFGRKKI